MGSVMTAPPAWPLQTNLELAALPTAVPCARLHVRSIAREWGLADKADVSELVVSELVTNAIQASDRLKARADLAIVPVVRISVSSDGESLMLRVWDASAEMPVRQEAGPGDDSGRGVMIIDALAKEWGTYQKANGKVVWAMIAPDSA
jgi:anti-sigma regulatory factor (Ser/Thr protein kinase)